MLVDAALKRIIEVWRAHGDIAQLVFWRGPVFAKMVLANAIKRASPKPQSAMLEDISEGGVTVDSAQH
ncbi:hypothetical protein Q3G72_013225 [Acer saccharum]|nr:hypothetical protein Q3G72_013225 [Acer saccharum]